MLEHTVRIRGLGLVIQVRYVNIQYTENVTEIEPQVCSIISYLPDLTHAIQRVDINKQLGQGIRVVRFPLNLTPSPQDRQRFSGSSVHY
jgi:hypothetical protein